MHCAFNAINFIGCLYRLVNSEANVRRITNVEQCFGASGQVSMSSTVTDCPSLLVTVNAVDMGALPRNRPTIIDTSLVWGSFEGKCGTQRS